MGLAGLALSLVRNEVRYHEHDHSTFFTRSLLMNGMLHRGSVKAEHFDLFACGGLVWLGIGLLISSEAGARHGNSVRWPALVTSSHLE